MKVDFNWNKWGPSTMVFGYLDPRVFVYVAFGALNIMGFPINPLYTASTLGSPLVSPEEA